ncbi:hypothetical protein EV644_117162, partial [Kribbella orskensis]
QPADTNSPYPILERPPGDPHHRHTHFSTGSARRRRPNNPSSGGRSPRDGGALAGSATAGGLQGAGGRTTRHRVADRRETVGRWRALRRLAVCKAAAAEQPVIGWPIAARRWGRWRALRRLAVCRAAAAEQPVTGWPIAARRWGRWRALRRLAVCKAAAAEQPVIGWPIAARRWGRWRALRRLAVCKAAAAEQPVIGWLIGGPGADGARSWGTGDRWMGPEEPVDVAVAGT